MYQFIFDEIFKSLEQQVTDHTSALSFGGPKDFPQYTELVGRIHGLRASINLVQDVQEMVNRQEEEDN